MVNGIGVVRFLTVAGVSWLALEMDDEDCRLLDRAHGCPLEQGFSELWI